MSRPRTGGPNLGEAIVGLMGVATVLLILWMVAYSGARSALGDTRVLFAANVQAAADGVHFTLANIGNGPAFSVTVRWSDLSGGEPLATSAYLGPLKPLEWEGTAVLPDETWSPRTLVVEWRSGTGPGQSVKRADVDVLAPSSLDAPPDSFPPDL